MEEVIDEENDVEDWWDSYILVKIFKDVEYPIDKKDIQNIIREYDKVTSSILVINKSNFSLIIIMYLLNLFVMYMLDKNHISTIIKLICFIPIIIHIIYDMYARIKIRIHNTSKTIKILKLSASFYMLVWECIFLSMLLLVLV